MVIQIRHYNIIPTDTQRHCINNLYYTLSKSPRSQIRKSLSTSTRFYRSWKTIHSTLRVLFRRRKGKYLMLTISVVSSKGLSGWHSNELLLVLAIFGRGIPIRSKWSEEVPMTSPSATGVEFLARGIFLPAPRDGQEQSRERGRFSGWQYEICLVRRTR
jgi:hypothetical protein